MSLGDMMTLLKLRRGEYAIVEEKVHPQAMVVGKALKDITLPGECVFVAILRKGQLIVPHGETVLKPVDEVIALIHSAKTGELAGLLGEPRRD
jgi:trk system potassium uptake protein TrkA